jgi:NAD(P)-dependent dehydrogenase (short-subunit alcohol dehydrogenase family)
MSFAREKDMNRLKGKVALVTGGSRGLGTVTAEGLAEQGADVAISYVHSADKAHAIIERLRTRGVRSIAIRGDQADPSSAATLVDCAVAEFGGLDILVNNAAIAVQGQRVDDPELDVQALDRQWQVNVIGVAALTRAAARVLAEASSSSARSSARMSPLRALPTMLVPRRRSTATPAASHATSAHGTSP